MRHNPRVIAAVFLLLSVYVSATPHSTWLPVLNDALALPAPAPQMAVINFDRGQPTPNAPSTLTVIPSADAKGQAPWLSKALADLMIHELSQVRSLTVLAYEALDALTYAGRLWENVSSTVFGSGRFVLALRENDKIVLREYANFSTTVSGVFKRSGSGVVREYEKDDPGHTWIRAFPDAPE